MVQHISRRLPPVFPVRGSHLQRYKAAIQRSPRFGLTQMICSVLIPRMHRWQFKSQIMVWPPCRFKDAQKKGRLYQTVFSSPDKNKMSQQKTVLSIISLWPLSSKTLSGPSHLAAVINCLITMFPFQTTEAVCSFWNHVVQKGVVPGISSQDYSTQEPFLVPTLGLHDTILLCSNTQATLIRPSSFLILFYGGLSRSCCFSRLRYCNVLL